MRNSVLLFFSLISAILVKAQIENRFIFPYNYNSLSDQSLDWTDQVLSFRASAEMKYLDASKFASFGCDGGPCASGTYKRIDFTKDGSLYAVGELYREKDKPYYRYAFKGPIEIYYSENDQLFCKGEYTGNGAYTYFKTLVDEKELFWPNGQLMKKFVFFEDSLLNRGFQRMTHYNQEGEVMADYELRSGSNNYIGPVIFSQESNKIEVPRTTFSRSITHYDVYPSYLNHGELGTYLGYRYLGTYTTNEGVSMTGFVWPMIESMGNGSVVYVEEANGKPPYYAIFFNGKIIPEYTVKATPIDVADFTHQLQENTDKSYESVVGYIAYKDVSQPVVNLKTKNIEQHTGYGIDYESSEDSSYAYTYKLKVGFFKDGKLNGLGYKVTLKQDFNYQGLVILYQYLDYEYGFFENDMLVKGKADSNEGSYINDNWTKPTNSAIEFSSRSNPPEAYMYTDKEVPYSFVWGEMYPFLTAKIYSKTVNRYFEFKDVDKDAKQIIVQGFGDEGLLRLDAKDELYFLKQLDPSTHSEECWICHGEGITSEVGYTTEYVPGGFVQEGIYYTYIYSYQKAVKKKYYYDAKCSKCNGKGVLDVGNVDIQYELRKITF